MTDDVAAPQTLDVEALSEALDEAITPGQEHLGPAVHRFDDWADDRLEQLRGHPFFDRLFTTASHVGDFSRIWQAVGLAHGIIRRQPKEYLVFATLIGVESLVVNQGIKRLFRRTRPTTTGDDRLPVRRPSTSSFPSGHASSAAFAVVLLSTWTPKLRGLWIAIGSIVGVSRAYVRIHHASDVVAGAVVGTALGLLARPVFRRTLDR